MGTNKHRYTRVLPAFVSALLSSSPSFGGSLYVSPNGSDSNPGTQSAPFRQIKKAAAVATAGTTVYVSPGLYSGDIYTSANGSASSPIRFVSTPKWGAKINSGSSVSAWDNRGSYVTIEGFEIDGSQATSWRWGIYSGASNSKILNNKVHDILFDPAQAAAAGSNGGAAMGGDNWYGATNIDIVGNVVYRIGPSGAVSSLVHGIYQTASGLVANNIVYDTAGVGIHLWHDAHDIDIINNTIYYARDGGIMVGSGDSGIGGGGLSSRAGDYVNVGNNIVVKSTWGISESGSTGIHNKYYNNLLYDNSTWNISLKNGLSHTQTIVADPKFTNVTGADFHLQAASPAIDGGSSSLSPATDNDGAPRPQGLAIDMGAFEYGGSSPSPSPTPLPPSASPALTTSVSTIPPGGSISVAVANGPGNASDWVGIYAVGTADTSFIDWVYLNGSKSSPTAGLTSTTLSFTLPTTLGKYEFRLFSNNSYTMLAKSTPVSVEATSPSVTVSSASVPRKSYLTVNIANAPGYATDWVGLYAVGAADKSFTSWQFLNGSQSAPASPIRSASLRFLMPSKAGNYEIRLYPNNSFVLAAKSITINVY